PVPVRNVRERDSDASPVADLARGGERRLEEQRAVEFLPSALPVADDARRRQQRPLAADRRVESQAAVSEDRSFARRGEADQRPQVEELSSEANLRGSDRPGP